MKEGLGRSEGGGGEGGGDVHKLDPGENISHTDEHTREDKVRLDRGCYYIENIHLLGQFLEPLQKVQHTFTPFIP